MAAGSKMLTTTTTINTTAAAAATTPAAATTAATTTTTIPVVGYVVFQDLHTYTHLRPSPPHIVDPMNYHPNPARIYVGRPPPHPPHQPRDKRHPQALTRTPPTTHEFTRPPKAYTTPPPPPPPRYPQNRRALCQLGRFRVTTV